MRAGATVPTIWLADLTYTQQQVSSDTMPAGIGGLAAFVRSRVSPAPEIRLFKYPERWISALGESGPRIAGFSNYVWNFHLSHAFARCLKRLSPQTIVVFGGPNYPLEDDEQARFLSDHPDIDFYVVGEGEVAFTRLVEACIACGYDVDRVKTLGLPGIQAVDRDGRFLNSPPPPRIRDLSEIPSAYVEGLMDEFFDGKLMPLLQTVRGCPFTCTFCVEGDEYFTKIRRNGEEKIAAEIDCIGRKMKKVRELGGRNDLQIADSNFGMYPGDLETCRQLARARETFGWPEYINATTGKNQRGRVLEAAELVDGALRLSGSVQSLDSEVLTNVKRDNIDAEGLMELALQANKTGALSYAEVILALPGDTVEKHFRTLRTVIDAGFKSVFPFQLMMLPGSHLATAASRSRFKMQTRFRVVPRCFGLYEVGGQTLASAEIEEICVALDTLSMEDYLHCREFHLVITCFHNDGIFQGLAKLLGELGLSRFEWLQAIFERRRSPEIGRFFEDFAVETRNELWASKEDLLAFASRPENLARFVRGELGGKLLFKYKALAITRCLRDLACVARSAVLEVIANHGNLSEGLTEFVDDLLLFETSRKCDLFSGNYDPRLGALKYDVQGFLAGRAGSDFRDYAYPSTRQVRFVYDASQREVLERNIRLFGRDDLGLYRALSKVYLEALYRRAETLLASGEEWTGGAVPSHISSEGMAGPSRMRSPAPNLLVAAGTRGDVS